MQFVSYGRQWSARLYEEDGKWVFEIFPTPSPIEQVVGAPPQTVEYRTTAPTLSAALRGFDRLLNVGVGSGGVRWLGDQRGLRKVIADLRLQSAAMMHREIQWELDKKGQMVQRALDKVKKNPILDVQSQEVKAYTESDGQYVLLLVHQLRHEQWPGPNPVTMSYDHYILELGQLSKIPLEALSGKVEWQVYASGPDPYFLLKDRPRRLDERGVAAFYTMARRVARKLRADSAPANHYFYRATKNPREQTEYVHRGKQYNIVFSRDDPSMKMKKSPRYGGDRPPGVTEGWLIVLYEAPPPMEQLAGDDSWGAMLYRVTGGSADQAIEMMTARLMRADWLNGPQRRAALLDFIAGAREAGWPRPSSAKKNPRSTYGVTAGFAAVNAETEYVHRGERYNVIFSRDTSLGEGRSAHSTSGHGPQIWLISICEAPPPMEQIAGSEEWGPMIMRVTGGSKDEAVELMAAAIVQAAWFTGEKRVPALLDLIAGVREAGWPWPSPAAMSEALKNPRRRAGR